MSLLKLGHDFSQVIQNSLLDSCKDTLVTNSVNIICNDGVVSCDPTVLVSVSKIWRKILTTTNNETVCIIAPDYTIQFMKRYLLSCIFGYEKETNNTSHFPSSKKDCLGLKK